MTGFYNITTVIKNQLLADHFCNSVTIGDIYEVDLNKQTIFPLSHIIVNGADLENNVWRFNLSVIAMDIVDKSKELTSDKFVGNDNEHDVLNTQHAVLNRLLEVLRRGSLRDEKYHLDGNPTLEPFTERFENYLAGWVATFDVLIPNDMTACDGFTTPAVTCEGTTLTIKDDEANLLYTINLASGETANQVISDSTVENSDASYSVSVNAEGSLVLPDSQVNVNSVDEGDVVSVKTIDINVTDGVDPVTPDSVTITGNTIEIQVTAGGTPTSVLKSSTIIKTDQNTSYRTGDDGDLKEGRATDFYTLNTTPVHADGSATANTTTDRFTDDLGGQTYTNDIVIDWSTYDNVAETVLGYTRNFVANTLNWNDSIDACLAYSVGSYTSGWMMPNIRELTHIKSIDNGITYSPFSFTASLVIFSSTNDSTNCCFAGSSAGTNFSGQSNKTTTTSRRAIAVRTFTVTGTSLT